MPVSFTTRLLEWYTEHARRLPWRGSSDPYVVWVSEIMLQQTRVETVIPYFERWMKLFPTLAALAQADQQEVLAAWEGLGYYSRARNLQRSAKIVLAEYKGRLPADVAALRKLPGIGRYSAAAIASMAFGADEAALDGNIRRVLARLFDVSEPARGPQGERKLWELARLYLPPGRAADYNQALMDLGATICLPRQPRCLECPLKDGCLAYRQGVQELRPVLPARPPVPHYVVTAGVIQREGRLLIARRPASGLLGGLWEFPGGKLQPGEDLPACLRREIQEELGVEIEVGSLLGVYRHA
ncbi:MAG TPA: A/G-specific adenine glycosylase, partial [Anaerolineales bacterium]